MINERIHALREKMKQYNIDYYYIPTNDYHNSEYVGAHFQERYYMSGFSGSMGTMIVGKESSYLWADGRYYVQAENEIKGSEITFKRLGSDGVETPLQFLQMNLPKEGVIGFDGKTAAAFEGLMMERIAKNKGGSLVSAYDLVGEIWTDRPARPTSNAFILNESYSGESTESKLGRIREVMKKHEAMVHVINSLDDIAWILNIRGGDIPATPVILSYLIIEQAECRYYVDESKLSEEVKAYFIKNNITVHPYDAIYHDVTYLKQTTMMDPEIMNYALYTEIKKATTTVELANPSIMMKSLKNETEIENLRIAHIKDGVAMTKFMYWLKQNIGKIEMDEVSVAEKLLTFREEQEQFIEVSFDTISAYNANAAMMHYHAQKETCAKLKPEGFLLVDSGGQYMNGTTDITRTFALGEVNPVWKHHFTQTLKGMSQLARQKFLSGCTGINLDILARQHLWNENIDYRSGTGHGVGFLLGVHEGPQGIRWRKAMNRKEDTPLMEGMIVTDEPGVYEEGSHGIRIENELVVKKDVLNEYGQFMAFETITFAPIDLDAIAVETLDEATKNWLNEYHEQVYAKLHKYLTAEEQAWLKEYTRKI
ncbi:peptidase M24 [Erysipelotrichaceae bacterium MTC7]|nr:peptidase M24 [Erysipelotrichaceae bacterium MTC7]